MDRGEEEEEDRGGGGGSNGCGSAARWIVNLSVNGSFREREKLLNSWNCMILLRGD